MPIPTPVYYRPKFEVRNNLDFIQKVCFKLIKYRDIYICNNNIVLIIITALMEGNNDNHDYIMFVVSPHLSQSFVAVLRAQRCRPGAHLGFGQKPSALGMFQISYNPC